MGFVKSMVGSNSGAGWNAQNDPNAQAKLDEQYQRIQGVQTDLARLAKGKGPNPALSQFQQMNDQNMAQNAGFIASQKGINPALAARLAAQNQGMMSQQAANSASTMMANQQLAALGQLGSLSGNVSGNLQAGINSANTANAGIQQQNAQGQFGLLNSAGRATAGLFAHGGMAPEPQRFAEGGPVSALGMYYQGNNSLNGNAGNYIGNVSIGQMAQDNSPWVTSPMADPTAGTQNIAAAGATDLSPVTSPSAVGGGASHMMTMTAAKGALVPGTAKAKGDNFKNDTVPALLSPKEIVLPRSVTLAPDAPKRAAEFVAKVLAQNGLRKKK